MPSSPTHCDCSSCPTGISDSYKVTVAGITEAGCGLCSGLNQPYTLIIQGVGGCNRFNTASGNCSVGSIDLGFSAGADGIITASVTFISGTVEYTASGLRGCCNGVTLSSFNLINPAGGCDWPPTVFLQAIGPSGDTDPQSVACVPACQPGCAPSSNVGCGDGQAGPVPPPGRCCVETEGPDCPIDLSPCHCPCCSLPQVMLMATIDDGCSCEWYCPSGTVWECDLSGGDSGGSPNG
jgi:hypothetical protein